MQQHATLSIGIAFRHAKIMQVESRTKQIWLFLTKPARQVVCQSMSKHIKTKAKQHAVSYTHLRAHVTPHAAKPHGQATCNII